VQRIIYVIACHRRLRTQHAAGLDLAIARRPT
jgi:hypothetical protein